MPIKMTRIRLSRIMADCFCPDCGYVRIATPSGAVCPQHKLMIGVEPRDLKDVEFATKLMELPRANLDPKTRCWAIELQGDAMLYVAADRWEFNSEWLGIPPEVVEATVYTEEYVFLKQFVKLRHLMAAL